MSFLFSNDKRVKFGLGLLGGLALALAVLLGSGQANDQQAARPGASLVVADGGSSNPPPGSG